MRHNTQPRAEIAKAADLEIIEFADAFSLPSLTRHANDFPVRVGLIKRYEHEKYSVLSDLIKLPQHTSYLLLTICPVTAETCKLHSTLYTNSSVLNLACMLSSIKTDISHCVSSLEKLYVRIKETDIVYVQSVRPLSTLSRC